MNIIIGILFFYLAIKAYGNFVTVFPFILVTYTLLGSFVVGSISPYNFLSVIVATIFFTRYNRFFVYYRSFPFKSTMFLFALSMICTNFFVSAKYRHTPTLVFNICQSVGYIYIIWYLLQNNAQKAIRALVKTALVFGCLVSLYALFETITRSNPLLKSLVLSGCYIESPFITEIRFGLKRAQAIFSMHTTLGGVMLFNYALLLVAYKTAYIKKTRLNIIAICLCAMCVFLTGARSCIIGLLMCTGMSFSKLKVSHILLLCFIIPFVFIFAGDYLSQIFDSIFNTEKVNGSNSDMRLIQFMISWDYMMRSPIIGNGLGFLYNDVVLNHVEKELFGAESLWFGVIADQGILGLVSYLLLFISPILYSWRKDNKFIILFVIGILVMHSLSTIPGVNPAMVLVFTLIFNYMQDTAKSGKIRKT
ncbi:O-antigen ligase family protein [Segatella copri]|uniref:O-antigen ligase family protein n=1 Tax=Segatella copri TaxID=165179 RepID=A0AAW5U553_9BACT|nr:O-antigen ligase family protein [Segatella copri]MCW4078474.1 O-antigen ligase family protein [Segatella copri]MCW4094693.1 O-antigen ligase family protein [Segatella copri]MCW4109899.1 O-antigen ligase family protein [Segatella copri]